MQERLGRIDHKADGMKNELQAKRGPVVAVQKQAGNMYRALARQDQRLERIEHRLELSDVPRS